VLDEEGGGNIASDNCDVLDPKTPQLQPDNNDGEGEDPGDEDKGGGDVIGGTMKVDGDEGGGDVDGDKIDELKTVGKTPTEEDGGVGGVASGGRGVETDKTPNTLPVNTCITSAIPPGEGGDRVAGGDRGVDTPVNTFNPRSTPPSPLSLRGAAPPTPACESSPKSRRPHSRLGASP
jgi:hypothetical protein